MFGDLETFFKQCDCNRLFHKTENMQKNLHGSKGSE